MGLSPTDAVEPEPVQLPEPPANDIEPLEVLVARALEKRLDLQETRDQVGDSERAASLAKQNLLPQFDVNLGVAQRGSSTSFGDAWRVGDRRVNVFFSTSYPLERTNDVVGRAQAVMDLQRANRGLRQRELEIQTEVRTAVRELERIKKSLELQKKGVEVAEQQRRLATLRYQRGLASNFDVVDAEGSLVLARSALVGLLTSYQIARIELLRATGDLDVNREFGIAAKAGAPRR
jgi:outer membrane protein TolC